MFLANRMSGYDLNDHVALHRELFLHRSSSYDAVDTTQSEPLNPLLSLSTRGSLFFFFFVISSKRYGPFLHLDS